MSSLADKFEVLGQLTEDCSYIYIPHYKIYQRELKKWVGKDLSIHLEVLRATRSSRQNRYIHGVICKWVGAWLEETQGEIYSHNEVYTWLRVKLLKEEPIVKTILGTEVIVMTGKRFSEMTTKEFSVAVEVILAKMAKRGCVIPIPKPKGTNMIHEFLSDD